MIGNRYRYIIEDKELNDQGYLKTLSFRKQMKFSNQDSLLKLAYLGLFYQIYEIHQN